MAQEVTNYARFYAALNRLRCPGSREELKADVVSQYTGGRTEHVREMTRKEYDDCCAALEALAEDRFLLRRERSVCLRLMQQIGVDTSDWSRVDGFCLHPRIAGKAFRRIRLEELEALERKLRAIKRKGGLAGGGIAGGEGAGVPGGVVACTFNTSAEC